MAFLPPDYNPPEGGSGDKYMRLVPGENRIRILASPILGNLAWTQDRDGKRHPQRARLTDPRPVGEDCKQFWAMPVWDYATHKIRVLEITQTTIMNSITSLSRSEDWGNPLAYDIQIHRKGSGLDTEYSVLPCPAKPVHPKILEELDASYINLEALYDGGDPFTPPNPAAKPSREPDDGPDEIDVDVRGSAVEEQDIPFNVPTYYLGDF